MCSCFYQYVSEPVRTKRWSSTKNAFVGNWKKLFLHGTNDTQWRNWAKCSLKQTTHYLRTTTKLGQNESFESASSQNSTKTMLYIIRRSSKILRLSQTSSVRTKNPFEFVETAHLVKQDEPSFAKKFHETLRTTFYILFVVRTNFMVSFGFCSGSRIVCNPLHSAIKMYPVRECEESATSGGQRKWINGWGLNPILVQTCKRHWKSVTKAADIA